MNDILSLKGVFEQRKNPNRPGPRNLPVNQTIDISHIIDLRNQLVELKDYWADKTLFKKVLVSVHYIDVIAKSNRIKDLLAEGAKGANESIVGAKFVGEDDDPKHVITHCINRETITKTIKELDICIEILNQIFSGKISYKEINDINSGKIKIEGLPKSKFVSLLADCFHVEYLGIDDKDIPPIEDNSVVTLYQTDVKASQIMRQIGISEAKYQQLDDNTFIVNPRQFDILRDQVPYLIAMAVSDITQIPKVEGQEVDEVDYSIPKPANEPVVGVIDTHFEKNNVYFSEWVDYYNVQSSDIGLRPEDFDHGTMVSSIIVDGPSLNPRLEDNCGRFRVRHFGVATKGKNNSSSIMRSIKRIIAENKDIKVWNLSLGSDLEIDKNFISPSAAILDQIQYNNDVVFIVSGTNDFNETNNKKLGSPADSINSVVVNSVDFDGKPAEYSRRGPVLSFFNKPDICYYGGTAENRITAYAPYGVCRTYGTSFAAPWIARKMAFLIYKMGFTREVAKALLIDAAAGWEKNKNNPVVSGYGVVPIKINDIVQCKDDEIRFILSEVSELFDTYNYNIPIPVYKDSQPFIAKATLCYFPKCSRNQGVDYTDTELDLHFGRIREDKIKSIDDNIQGDLGQHFLKEGSARQFYRKWDNIKLIGEEFKTSARARKVYGDGRWGISLKTKERLWGKAGEGLKFGVVITLKEINGQNRLEEFIRLCSLRGWLVNRIKVENKIEIYTKAEEEIELN